MKITDIIGMCLRSLWRRKLRTLLTVLGVVIGSCAIIVMISLGLGSNKALEQSLKQMGELNVVDVYPKDGGGGGATVMMMGGGSSNGSTSETDKKGILNDETLAQIQEIDGVTAVFPTLRINGNTISINAGKNGRYTSQWLNLIGVYPEAIEKFGYKFEKGELPPAGSDTTFAIFGSDAAYNFRDSKKKRNNMVWPDLLPNGTVKPPFFDPMTDPMLLTVNNTKDAQKGDGEVRSGGRGYEHKLKCAGILKQDYAKYESVNSVMIDMAFAKQLVADSNRLNGVKDKKDITFNGLKIWADDLDKIAGIQKAVEELGFNASSMDSIRQELQGQVVKQQMLLGGLAAISLFVAAIGITNTMIMSIYERTREIGVMKVLGCFIGNIRQIFLLESGCIGFLGGVVGSIISFIISIILNTVGGNAMGMGNMYMGKEQVKVAISIIPPWLVILAIAFSTVIGLISGFSPANRAVKISALEAIKND